MDTIDNLEENSALIADFLGWEKTTFGYMVPNTYTLPEVMDTGKTEFSTKWMQFHTSWDWLMPVIIKISNTVYEEYNQDTGIEKIIIKDRAYPRTFGMINQQGLYMFRFNRMACFESETLIQAAYNACVDFIKMTIIWTSETK